MNKSGICLIVGLCLLGCDAQVEDTRPGQPVRHRQLAFKQLVKDFEPMGVMLRGKRFDPEQFLALAEAVHAQREAPWQYFGPETNYPPSKSKPAVWEQPGRFEQERLAFLDAVDALVSAAKTKDRAQVEGPFQRVQDACQSCHKLFRER